MKRLIILRHAKAEKDAPRRADVDRALAPRGAADAAEAGRRLARREAHPDAIVSSPARRTLETARIVARELDFPWRAIQLEQRAYLADADTLLDIARETGDAVETLLLVGHNPGVTDLAQTLVRRFAEELRTCGMVAIDCAVDTWGLLRPGCGSLRWHEVPRARD